MSTRQDWRGIANIVLVTGSRHRTDDVPEMRTALDQLLEHLGRDNMMVLHGDARGVDAAALRWARDRCIPHCGMPADWTRHGRGAGPKRNERMLKTWWPNIVLAFPAPDSRGTRDMIGLARNESKFHVDVYVWESGKCPAWEQRWA